MDDRVIGKQFFGSWTATEKIGEGAFGKVYRLERNNYGLIGRSALKIITIPQSEAEVKSLMSEGLSTENVKNYFSGLVKEIVNEIALMAKLKGNSNVVSYEDHSVVEHTDKIGWDILIRMECLNPVLEFYQSHDVTRKDIIKLGIDICSALELCQKYNIVHRDIKPENIFVSESGDYKLGDFGIARTVEKTMGGLSKKGTYTYMAPEVYKGESYGTNIDIYSLGIVLYRFLNNNRTPFMPNETTEVTYSQREQALVKRMSGAELPPPVNATDRLAEIVLKACAYDSSKRYSSPTQMKEDLQAVYYNTSDSEEIFDGTDKIDIHKSQFTFQNGKAPVKEKENTRNMFSDDTYNMFTPFKDLESERKRVDFENEKTPSDSEQKDNQAELEKQRRESEEAAKKLQLERERLEKEEAENTDIKTAETEKEQQPEKEKKESPQYDDSIGLDVPDVIADTLEAKGEAEERTKESVSKNDYEVSDKKVIICWLIFIAVLLALVVVSFIGMDKDDASPDFSTSGTIESNITTEQEENKTNAAKRSVYIISVTDTGGMTSYDAEARYDGYETELNCDGETYYIIESGLCICGTLEYHDESFLESFESHGGGVYDSKGNSVREEGVSIFSDAHEKIFCVGLPDDISPGIYHIELYQFFGSDDIETSMTIGIEVV